MNIHVKTKDVDLTPALQQWIDEKIGSLGDFVVRYEKKGEILCEVEVARTNKHHNKGEVFYAEVNMQLPDKMLRATVEHADIRTALDIVRDMLHRDLMKYKSVIGRSGLAAKRMAHSSQKALAKLMWWRNK